MLAVLLLLTASASSASSSDAYLWQREGGAEQVRQFAGWSSGALHVLAFDDETPKDRGFVRKNDEVMKAARATGVPVIATVRLQRLSEEGADAVVAAASFFASSGARLVAVEVDHDCGVGRLPVYAAWLRELNKRLAVPLHITALPSWLLTPMSEDVFSAVDDVVLQVHAVQAPALLDVDDALAAIARRPHVRVALPTYATTLKGGATLAASPDDVACVRAAAERVAWFRLGDDDSAWSFATLQAVDARAAVHGWLEAAEDGDGNLMLVNKSGVDVAVPCVRVSGAVSKDVVAGFFVDDDGSFCPTSGRFLAPGKSLTLGWARPDATAPGGLRVALAPRDPAARISRCR